MKSLLAGLATGLVLAVMAGTVVVAIWKVLPVALYIVAAVLVLAGGSDLLDRLEQYY